MYRINCFFSVVLIVLSLSSTAQEKQKMNIGQLVEYAQNNSFRMKEAKFDKLKNEAVFKEVRGEGLPQIKAEIEYKDYLTRPTMILPGALTGNPQAPDIKAQFGKKYNLDAGVQVSQLLFSLQYIYGVRTANKANELADLGEEKTELDIIHQMYSEYFNLLAIYKNLEIIDSNVESLLQSRSKTKALVEADMALSTDLDRIDVNLANLKASRRQGVSGINIQTNNLKILEKELQKLHAGQKVIIKSAVYAGQEFEGRVSVIGKKAGMGNSFDVEISLKNRKDSPLSAGMFVTTDLIDEDETAAIYVPRRAINGSLKDASIYVVKENKANKLDVVVGRVAGDMIEIVEGLKNGDEVVVAGKYNVYDGATVKIMN